ncbi:DUF1614 domain-containing protein [Dongia sedimenti]|uniref:DUF1614 domain-containing protein n=1 Tax=Dongia sedimenti TaxID=3064282 RepID=A0ABU0YU69_9PROT|nr:DUF1614 domain-containing protein [Rhodospirillaceae bacterium R-7]
MLVLVWLSLLVALLLIVLLPVLFAGVMAVSLAKLHLSPGIALLLVLAVIIGGFINIPIRRIQRSVTVDTNPLSVLGLHDLWPELRRFSSEVIVAVNLGGCVIPTGLALYELANIAILKPHLLGAVGFACVANVAACYFLARPIPGLGIGLPGLVPGCIAAVAALLAAPDQAPPVAFIAGVAGPLVGADLLHLKEVEKVPSGILSIGGAGTFDGIILSGVIAAYLA